MSTHLGPAAPDVAQPGPIRQRRRSLVRRRRIDHVIVRGRPALLGYGFEYLPPAGS